MRYLYILAVVILLKIPLFAQDLKLTGTVYDDDTKEPIPFCNVYVPGSIYGVLTDIDGAFELNIPATAGDSIAAGILGYTTESRLLDKKQTQQTIYFRLKSAAYSMGVVEVVAGENPANAIVRQIIKHKPDNDKDRYDSYEAEMYSKMELDLDDIDDELRNRPIFKKFQFVFDNVDSVSDEKPFLPAYLAERMYDVYYIKNGAGRKEMLKAQQVSGVRNQSVIDFINSLHEYYNIYTNWMTLLGKEFVSPFSDQGLGYYEYYIIDSTHIKNRWCYKLKFKPKRVEEPTFYGDFWVDMGNYGIVIANMRMSPEVNINFVERILLYYEADLDERTRWMSVKEKTVVDFKGRRPETQQEISIVARKTVCHRNYKVNDPATTAIYKKQDPEEVRPELLEQDTAFWNNNRFEQLSKHEASVYAMIDSVQHVPMYRTFADIINTLATGYKVLGPIEIGPYWDILTFNEIEKLRIGCGLGTSTRWLGKDNPYSKKIRFYGYVGYGLRDKKLKYNGLFEYVFSKYRRTEIGLEYTDWVSFENRSSEEQSSQSLLAGAMRRDAPQKLLHVREAKIYYQHGWKLGFRNRLVLMHRTLTPYDYRQSIMGGFNFKFLPDANDPNRIDTSFTTAEIIFTTRFAYKEKVLTGNFSDISAGTKYPIVQLKYVAGIKGILGSQYNYHRVSLGIDHWFYIRPVGWISYQFDIGKVFGRRIPYLFLEVHPGNEGYFYNEYAFNGMNNYEFVSDFYMSFRIEHHWDGFFFNRIPFFRKLKLREVVSFRGVWGTLTAANKDANRLNHYDRGYRAFNPNVPEGPFYGGFDKGPYMECAVGIENILNFFRIDALWRLTYLRNHFASKFSVRITLGFNF